MDSQFNTLVRSYSDNYIQFKVTGSPKYQTAYQSAQQGLESILSQLGSTVNNQKRQISEFYKSGVEQKLQDLEQKNKFLQRGIVDQKDELTASTMRAESPSPLSSIQTWQYYTLGGLAIASVALSLL